MVGAETTTRHAPVEMALSFKCTHPKCKYIAKRRGDLKRHLADIHDEGAIWYTCSRANCEYATKRKGNLKRHLVLMHSDNDEDEVPPMAERRDVHNSKGFNDLFSRKEGSVDGDLGSKMGAAYEGNKLSSYEKYVFKRQMAIMQRDMYMSRQWYYARMPREDYVHALMTHALMMKDRAAREDGDMTWPGQSLRRREDFMAKWQMSAVYHGMRSPTVVDMKTVGPKRIWMDQERGAYFRPEHGTPIFSYNASTTEVARSEEGSDYQYIQSTRLTHRGLENHNMRIAMENGDCRLSKTTSYRVSKVLSDVERCIEYKFNGESSDGSDTTTVTLGSTIQCPVQSNGASRLERDRNNGSPTLY